jgi:hypothetical protein
MLFFYFKVSTIEIAGILAEFWRNGRYSGDFPPDFPSEIRQLGGIPSELIEISIFQKFRSFSVFLVYYFKLSLWGEYIWQKS